MFSLIFNFFAGTLKNGKKLRLQSRARVKSTHYWGTKKRETQRILSIVHGGSEDGYIMPCITTGKCMALQAPSEKGGGGWPYQCTICWFCRGTRRGKKTCAGHFGCSYLRYLHDCLALEFRLSAECCEELVLRIRFCIIYAFTVCLNFCKVLYCPL